MRRTWQIVYLFFFALVIGSFGIAWCLDKLDVPVPEELGLEKNRSYLEGKTYASFPEPTLASFESGEFQDDVESFVADRFPARDGVLLANVAWQRSLIEISAVGFGYDVYPTFYGSDYAYDAPRDEVVQILDPANAEQVQTYERAAEAYRSFAERHPELNCYFYEVDRMSSSTRNPTHDLMGPSVDTELLDEHFFDLLGDQITRIEGSFADTDALAEAFFRTDHHWNGAAAYEEYAKMLDAMMPGAEPAQVVDCVTWDNVAFYGSTSRSGLCLTDRPDHIVDCLVDISGYEVVINDAEQDPSVLQHNEAYAAGEIGNDLFTNRYSEYFHSDRALIEVFNRNATSDDTLLIIGDSFSNVVEKSFAQNYRHVYVYDPRYAEEGVESFLVAHEVENILFLMGSTTFPSDQTVSQLR